MYRQCPCDVQLRFQARLGIFDRKIGITQVISLNTDTGYNGEFLSLIHVSCRVLKSKGQLCFSSS